MVVTVGLFLKKHSEGVTITIKVKPRSSRTGPDAASFASAELIWRLQSAPVDGQANAELVFAVAKYFGIPKSNIELILGEKSKSKVLLLKGVQMENIRSKIL